MTARTHGRHQDQAPRPWPGSTVS